MAGDYSLPTTDSVRYGTGERRAELEVGACVVTSMVWYGMVWYGMVWYRAGP